MDIRKDPPQYKPRRFRGTPAWGFVNKFTFIILGVSSIIGVGLVYSPICAAAVNFLGSDYLKESEESKIKQYRRFAPVSGSITTEEAIKAEEDRKTML